MSEESKPSKQDHFDAARTVVSLLQPFDAVGRERIIRWAREELGMSVGASAESRQVEGTRTGGAPTGDSSRKESGQGAPPAQTANRVVDLKAFVESKAPKTDQHFAAVVAYYHAFEAPEGKRKHEIGPDDYLEACRLAPWRRPGGDPLFPLRNAFNSGLFDKGSAAKLFKLSTVGENLVAMALPTSKSTDTGNGKVRGGRRAHTRNGKAGEGRKARLRSRKAGAGPGAATRSKARKADKKGQAGRAG